MVIKFQRNQVWIACAILLSAAVVACGVTVAGIGSAQEKTNSPEGYTDTPYLPGGRWRVHDLNRPHPALVTPGRVPGQPPSDAIVLFDGKDLSKWEVPGSGADAGKMIPARWKVENGYMEIAGGSGSIITKEKFGDCQLHIEWASPAQISGNSQGRGNSGVLMMGRYEIQVLDSFDNVSYADGQAGAMYGQYPPLVNPARKPGEWQTYDLVFEVPRFEGDKLVKPAHVTLFFNGVVVHNRQASIGQVAHRQVGKYAPHEPEAPLMLQDHRNPVRYRNIWIRRLGKYPGE
jgi:hypothetical protein